jgi:tetratricopeptide (TPR) repeat protein/peptidoglycan/xylan/chitin deacetylase (PgdA/CDA1 family)
MVDSEKIRTPEKVSYSLTWLYFLFILCMIIAWAIPIKIFLDNYFMPVEYQGPRTSDSFLAVVYEGVSSKTNEVSPEAFKEQIQTLRANGYVPITLQDVRNFYYEGRKLPDKAILTTFDHSRKSSFFETRSVLKRNYWHGVMFLWLKPILDGDPAALLWPYITRMAKSANWELGVQSYDGFSKIPIDHSGAKANFMTSRMWLDNENRYESVDEFRIRLMKDHLRSLELVEKRIGFKPSAYAYAYPYGDFGNRYRKSVSLKNVNMDLVNDYYDLGFTSGNFPLNTSYTDPRRLNRLVVKHDMSVSDLLLELENSWPDNSDVEIVSPILDSSKWFDDWGDKILSTNSLVLKASENSTGARMWLAGSDERLNFYVKINFKILDGQFGVFLRGTPDEERCVYLGIDTTGDIWVRQKHVGTEFFTLASAHTIFRKDENHELEIYLRDNLFGIMLDGKNVLKERVMLLGTPQPGMIGLSIWDKSDPAAVKIGIVEIKSQKPALASWLYNQEEVSYFANWVHKNGFKLTNLCPYWYSIRGAGYLQQSSFDDKIVGSLCKMYNLKFTPTITINDEEYIYELPLKSILAKIQSANLDGIYLDISDIDTFDSNLLGNWLSSLDRKLDATKAELLVNFPKRYLSWQVLQPIISSLTNVKVVSDNIDFIDAMANTQVDVVETEKVPVPTSVDDIPLSYQIDPNLKAHGELSRQNKIQSLRREGYSAFKAGDYLDAIALWKTWEELEPNDSTPSMLIGDAYVRLDEKELAYKYYTKSLNIDPGRVSFAMRLARLLEDMGRGEEAVEQMNTYALLFPENVDVLLAQADWLDRHGRAIEGNKLLVQALEFSPENFDLLVAIMLKSEDSVRREQLMQKIVSVGSSPETYAQLANAIEKYDLLTLPEGYSLAEMCAKIADDPNVDPDLADRFKQFKIIREPIYEYITDGTLSDNWTVSGGIESSGVNEIQLYADKHHREAFLKLVGSSRIQDGWLEVDLGKYLGEFWLIGHKSPDKYVRFGISTNRVMYLQARQGGSTFSSRSKELERYASGTTKLRLEIRGNGANGYIDGEPISNAPISLPVASKMGAWGVIAYSSQLGQARAELGYIAAGPLPFTLAILDYKRNEADQEKYIKETLEHLKEEKRYLSAIAPSWYSIGLDGEVFNHIPTRDRLIKIFAKYHGIRLTPAIRLSKLSNVSILKLKKHAIDNHFDGFVLITDKMPGQKWFDMLNKELASSAVEIFVLVDDNNDENTALIRASGFAKDLLEYPNSNSQLSVLNYVNEETGEKRAVLNAALDIPTLLYY